MTSAPEEFEPPKRQTRQMESVGGHDGWAANKFWFGVCGALAVQFSLGACGGTKNRPGRESVQVPARRATSGDRLLRLAPSGADALLEIDLARLRENRAVGPLVQALTDAGAPDDLVAGADLLLFASYGVGGAAAEQLVLAAGPRVGGLRRARRVADGVVGFGPAALLARLDAVRSGQAAALTADRRLLRARAMAMPARAQGASVRMSASLGFEARLALARRLDLDAVPAWLSVWIDVADDLAAVALLGGDADSQPDDLARAVERLRKRVIKTPLVARLGLARLAQEAQISVRQGQARVVIVIGPRRLAQLVDRVMARLAAEKPAGPGIRPGAEEER
jgi:hypothetical protein